MNKLYIDTRDNKKIIIRISSNSKTFEEAAPAAKDKSQAALLLIEKVLKKAKIKTSEISEIEVEKGPGAFTGIRVGVAIANALGFSLNIPINGKKLGELEVPEY